MRKIILSFAVFAIAAAGVQAGKPNVLYTFILNKTSGGASVPVMIGFANISADSQNGTQMGFFNHIGNDLRGAQFGFANIVRSDLQGAQFGFSNIAGGELKGAQFGFANILSDHLRGAQFGFANLVGEKLRGAQFGFVNIAGGYSNGAQFGFASIVRSDFRGAQFGFANMAKTIRGFQAGFVNIADRYEAGVPLGFLNIVKEGGYQAIEYAFNDLYPVNVSLMTGVPHFYSIVGFSYHSGYRTKFAIRGGVGSIIELNRSFDFIPEAVASWGVATKENEQFQTYALKAKFGLDLFSGLSLTVGPVVSWRHSGKAAVLENNFLNIHSFDPDSRNRINIGFELSLRYAINRGN